jgi:thiamine-phosphate pyrophosphorylase
MADGCFLYYITDRKAFAPDEPTRRRRLLEKIAEAVLAGVHCIQLREKDLSTRELESLAREVVRNVNETRQLTTGPFPLTAAVLINSRADIALATHTDGIHLRADDISPHEVELIWRKSHVGTAAFGFPDGLSAAAVGLQDKKSSGRPLIAVSCHSPDEVRRAEADGATFAVFGPVFEKKAAPKLRPTGLEQLREACKAKIPVLALGGITLENAEQCLAAGARGIAAIRLFQENDIAKIVRQLRQPRTG